MDLRDKFGKVIGRILESNGELRAYDSIGAYVGKYITSTNTTYDKWGSYYGSGNLLGMLIDS